ncbi:Tah11p ASCRUDRAFT_69779 [Ascoidea rubescens DSM 1968]|uniref:DNA replication factor Cdt1 C-terminal domain-containing protein n=1 Tax=Ascoidea rubescens DSM 1968 TaxID=1344418 RepID=A0A1D2VKG3_9ASCO|nr:hypothetical protein ASCRUDRAFT_69779 [Ascoidea rubescens DSM 1968]ODV62096.1 hypothetical protein ASCRUDRAFT_69779 [Ascoidea rubescens DSM 1968]
MKRKKKFNSKIDNYIQAILNDKIDKSHNNFDFYNPHPIFEEIEEENYNNKKRKLVFDKNSCRQRKILKSEIHETITINKTENSNTNNDPAKKLSLLERIRLKEKNKLEANKLKYRNNTIDSNKPIKKIKEENYLIGKLKPVFNILYFLENNKPYSINKLAEKILDSSTSTSLSTKEATQILNIMDKRLPNEIFQIVEFKNGKPSNENETKIKEEIQTRIVKFNFFNKRDEILKYLS